MWIFFAILAPLCFAVVNHIDEHLVKRVSTPGALMIFSGLFGFVMMIFSFILATIGGFSIITNTTTMIALVVAGIFEAIWFILYLKALETDDVALVVPWFQLVPVFVAVLGFLFLNEKLGSSEIIAGILIITGATILSIDWSSSFKFKKRESSLMIGAALCISLGVLIFKAFAITEPSFWVASFWMSLGMGITTIGFLFYKPYRDDFVELIETSSKKVLGLNITNEILNSVGVLSTAYASLLVPIAYVSTASSLQPVFVIIIGLFIALQKKDWLLFNRKTFIPLLLAIIFIVIGGILFAQTQ